MNLENSTPNTLKREIGVFGAMMMGLGSIIGTGVFVSIGIAAGVTGPSVLLAIVVAACIATCNGLSSAQLAANHPASGGTYEYGYRWLNSSLGFTAGWMFLCAKSASAATAALGFGGYALHLFGRQEVTATVSVAVGVVIVTTVLVLSGIRRSNWTNIVIVSVTLLSLGAFVAAGVPSVWQNGTKQLQPFFVSVGSQPPVAGFLEACALMFVAFTGYGRIATLGEEVAEPHLTIPKAIIITLVVSTLLYVAVGFVGVATAGSEFLFQAAVEQSAPLEMVARQFETPQIAVVVSIGAVTAMLGVLLNLVLGLSRVMFAMGRRQDLPRIFAEVDSAQSSPYVAVIAVGIMIASLTLIGDVKTTWSFSAFTVLVYYAITNLSAIQLSDSERLYPRAIPWLGLAGCLSLAFWVETRIWGVGLVLIAGGLVFQFLFRRLAPSNDESDPQTKEERSK